MEEQGHGGSSSSKRSSNNGGYGSGYLDTSKAERAMWLMKCPPLVSRSLSAPPSDPSRPLAKVVVSIDPLNSSDANDDSPPQFTMELAGSEAGHIPRCFAMDMSKDFIPMSVFSDTPQGKLSVEGKILNKFDMRPHKQSLELYGKLCRERTKKYMVKTRQIQVIDNDSGAHMRPMPGMFTFSASGHIGKILNKFDMRPHKQSLELYGKLCRERTKKYMVKTRQIQVIDNDSGAHMRPMPGMFTFSASGHIEKKKTPAKGTDMKRTRRDRGEMEEIVFKLFERQSNWSLRNLIQETNQPEQFLKDILKDLCVYNNKGTNQGTYELKPEYRKSGD